MDLYNQIRHPRRLNDEERPHPIIWWLAGGQSRRCIPARGVPTGAVLRERREVERQNREAVGFLGTLVGAREVHQTRRQLREAAGRVLDAAKDKKDKPEEGSAEQAAVGNNTAASGDGPDQPEDATAREAAEQAKMDAAKAAP
ncbi:hypothetical protein LTR97_006624 [Elasticomyces elasticus]|uniref:Uncharacterized protein n=1 Tax=Elasticomyces elasticus TaxID=574655 RepID=A0AAN7W6U6_9PEZI|nr:hypothetical protein LTR97_006624 [Elasticomyces elasticus]